MGFPIFKNPPYTKFPRGGGSLKISLLEKSLPRFGPHLLILGPKNRGCPTPLKRAFGSGNTSGCHL